MMKAVFCLALSLLRLQFIRHVSASHCPFGPQAPALVSRLLFHGGAQDSDVRPTSSSNNDEERYSRQVYAVGARAHNLIRSATVLLDGPCLSGLVYETAKNLALSGVKRIVLVTSLDDMDINYYNSALDDLGGAYCRAARHELGEPSTADPAQVLKEYIQLLNPSVSVSIVPRTKLAEQIDSYRDNSLVLVALDRPFSTLLALNEICRRLQVAFCATNTAGVFGMVFCDFGDDFVVHDADGETPLATPLDAIRVNDDGKTVVHCVDGEKHDLSKGDLVQFTLRDGSVCADKCWVEQILTPFRFEVRLEDEQNVDAFCSRINQQAATFSRIKEPQTLHFCPLREAIARIKDDAFLFTACDLEKCFDLVRRDATVASFRALSTYVERHSKLPGTTEHKSFWNLVKASHIVGLEDSDRKQAKRHCKHFAQGCAAKLVPMQTIFGAIAAQEALKAVSGLYCPVHQFLLYDCDEVLQSVPKAESGTPVEATCTVDSVPGLRDLLGDAIADTLISQRVFVVGAGAIGCEVLKNLAALGVSTGDKGKIHVTDMDTIEKSNLSRQFLFRDSDIGSFKSAAAHEAVLRFNPAMNIESHSSKVGGASSAPFDEDFWSTGIDIVLNALDNIEARLYIDRQCVSYQKALVDSGTLGSKGNVQVVVPFQSESYASSADPPEQGIPVCTLKNFPYAISHTIQWGRDLFDGLYQSRPSTANKFMDSLKEQPIADLIGSLMNEQGTESAQRILSELKEDLEKDDGQDTKRSCLDWAVRLSRNLFHQSVAELMSKHPLNSVDEDGEPFWTGVRRPPVALIYDDTATDDDELATINANLIQFVQAAARLRAESTDPDWHADISQGDAEDALRSMSFEETEPSSGHMEYVIRELEALTIRNKSLAVVDFEKDDETNGHVDFVTAASNLRAISYGIPPVDSMETRRVAGNIVPAMITTTAFVAGLSCLELIKLVQGAPLQLHRNAFINLALPFFAFTSPLPADEIPGIGGQTFTIWDRLTFKEKRKDADKGGLSIRSLIRRIEKKVSTSGGTISVASISIGEYMLYAGFLHADDDGVLNANLWNHVSDSVAPDADYSGRSGDENVTVNCEHYLDLTVTVEDTETGDELELPPVRVHRYKLT